MVEIFENKRISIIVCFIIFLHHWSFCQKQGNIWYFGDHAGISFNSGTPVALLNGQTSPVSVEGTSAIADSSGSLLFYSNGITIWNKTHAIMQNGTGLLGNFSSTQSSIIVPDPANPNRYYYIFTISSGMCCGGNISDGLRYSKIDMCLDSSRGGVISNQKNIKLVDTVAEKIAVTRHANGIDYWILTHKFYSDKFYALHLSPTGITDTVISSIGTMHTGSLFGTQGQMKISPDGKRVAVAASNNLTILDLFDFNNASGVVSNYLNIDKPFNNNANVYGVEFSPDNSKLYAAGSSASGAILPFLVQYDLSSNNITSINASLYSLYNNTTGLISGIGLQLGPDGKIYMPCKNNLGALSVINNPNLPAPACNYIDQAVSLGGKNCPWTLPSFISNFDYSNKLTKCSCVNPSITLNLGNDTTLCQNTPLVLNTNLSNVTYNWQDNSTGSTYTVTQQGTYWVDVKTNTGCYITDSINVLYKPVPYINLGNDTGICQGHQLVLTTNNINSTFVWQDNSIAPSYTVTQQGHYWITVTTNGCSSSDSITVNYIPIPVIHLGNDTTLCEGDQLVLTTNNINSTFVWQDNSIAPSYTVTQQGHYWLTVTTNGCSSADTITVNYTPSPIIHLGNDTTLCQGEQLVLNANNINSTFVWQDHSTGSSYSVAQQGLYWVTVTTAGCLTTDSILIYYNNLPVVNLGSDKNICQGETMTLDVTDANATYNWQDNSGNSTYIVNEPGIYWVKVTKNNCSNSDSIFVNVITCDITIKVPNVFTPNNDHINDLFIPQIAAGISNTVLSIYNRWGTLLFETTDMSKGWDGKVKGNESPAGTYYWILSFTTDKNETKTWNGFLTLIR